MAAQLTPNGPRVGRAACDARAWLPGPRDTALAGPAQVGAMLDLPSLLQPVSALAPAGPNLDSRADYLEFEVAAAGKPERQNGATIVPAEPPDWNLVIERSVALLRETKDLRVAAQLVRALLQTGSFAGLAEGLALVRHMVDAFWDNLHPELDADDDNAPTARIAAIRALVHRDMIQAVRSASLIESRTFGRVSLRDFDAVGRGEGAAGAAASLEAVFRQAPLDELSAAHEAVAQCSKEAGELAETWFRRLGPMAADGFSVDFSELRKVLAHANTLVKARLIERHSASAGGAPEPNGEVTLAEVGLSAGGAVRTREDVVRALESVCAYYARHEPSSPVPLLIERCKRLVQMSFLEIVTEMMPDGLSTIQTIAGKQDAGR